MSSPLLGSKRLAAEKPAVKPKDCAGSWSTESSTCCLTKFERSSTDDSEEGGLPAATNP